MFNPLPLLNPYMFWIKIAGFVLALGAAAGATHYVDANVYGKQIANMKLDAANLKVTSISESLKQLQRFIDKMNSADTDYNAKLDIIRRQFATIQQELANAIHTPLPADCLPTADRVRVLHDALAAVNAHTAPGK